MKKNCFKIVILITINLVAISACASSYIDVLRQRKKECESRVPGQISNLASNQEKTVFSRPDYEHIDDFRVTLFLARDKNFSSDGINFEYLRSSCPELFNDENVIYGFDVKKHIPPALAVVHKDCIDDVLGYGVMAVEDIAQNSLIRKFAGNIDWIKTEDLANNDYYMYLSAGKDSFSNAIKSLVIDPSVAGNESRFANHSYTPNCEIVFVKYKDKIQPWLRSLSKIKAGDDVTWDYGFNYWQHRGIQPKADKEIPIFQGSQATIYAVNLADKDAVIKDVIFVNGEPLDSINYLYHEVMDIDGHHFITIIDGYKPGCFRPLVLSEDGTAIESIKEIYGQDVFNKFQQKFKNICDQNKSKWNAVKN